MIPAMRDELADMLTTALGVPVHAYPPGSVVPPVGVVLPGSPYIDGQFLTGAAGQVAFDLQLVAQGNAPRALDDLVWDTVAALGGHGIHVDQVTPPTYSEAANTIGARISITLKWKA